MQKRMFKVLSPIEKHGGGHYWMRCGSGFTNKDDSINIYLDAIPRTWQLQLRELDEEDLRKREAYAATKSAAAGAPSTANELTTIPF